MLKGIWGHARGSKISGVRSPNWTALRPTVALVERVKKGLWGAGLLDCSWRHIFDLAGARETSAPDDKNGRFAAKRVRHPLTVSRLFSSSSLVRDAEEILSLEGLVKGSSVKRCSVFTPHYSESLLHHVLEFAPRVCPFGSKLVREICFSSFLYFLLLFQRYGWGGFIFPVSWQHLLKGKDHIMLWINPSGIDTVCFTIRDRLTSSLVLQ